MTGEADQAVKAFLAGTLSYDPDVQCSHQGEHREEGEECGCGEDCDCRK